MRYAGVLPEVPEHRHKSTGGEREDQLVLSETAARRLAEFARESTLGDLKYMKQS